MLEEHWNFTDNLPVAEIIESQTSKSCKDSNILIFIRCNKMEFQDWMEEYIFHIILLQKYEYALYFTIGERRIYQQRKKKGIYEVKPPRKATQDKLELYSRYFWQLLPKPIPPCKKKIKNSLRQNPLDPKHLKNFIP